MAFWTIDTDSPRIMVPPPLIFATFWGAGWGLDRLAGWVFPLSHGVRLALMGVSGVLGVLMLSAALWGFVRARTSPEPWKTTRVVIDRGLYAYSRNPMYLAMALLYAGMALALGGPCTLGLLVPVVAIIRTQVIAREERYLDAKFGAAYRAYRARVRRWF